MQTVEEKILSLYPKVVEIYFKQKILTRERLKKERRKLNNYLTNIG